MDQFKKQFIEIVTKYKIVIIAVAAVLVLAIAGSFALRFHNNNIISRVQVEFTGYDGSGTASIKNAKEVSDYMYTRALKKEGMKKDAIKDFIASGYDDSILSYSDQASVSKVSDELATTDLSFQSSTENLKNGDKITVKFSNSNSDLPFRSGKKTFKVKGLKKTSKVSSQKILNKLNIKAYGVNGKGQITLSSKDDNLISGKVKIKNNGSLSNGDKVSLTLPKSAFSDSTGKHQYKGTHTIEYKVAGLMDAKIKNINEIKSTIDTVMSDYTKNRKFGDITYTSKFVNLYAVPYDSDSEGYDFDYAESEEDETVPTKVEITDSRDTDDSDKDKLSIIAIYTVTPSDSDEDPEDVQVTVDNLTLKDGSLNIKDKKLKSDDDVRSLSDSIKTFEHNLSVTGLKIK